MEKDGGHDVYPDECDKSMTWLAARTRNFWSRDVRWTADPGREGRCRGESCASSCAQLRAQ